MPRGWLAPTSGTPVARINAVFRVEVVISSRVLEFCVHRSLVWFAEF